MDRTPGPDPTTSYINWGTLVMNTSVIPEPNNQYPPEYCVVANYSMASSDGLWGWADTNCTAAMFPYICKLTRERPAVPGVVGVLVVLAAAGARLPLPSLPRHMASAL